MLQVEKISSLSWFSTGVLLRIKNVIYLYLDQVVVVSTLYQGEILKRPFDEIRVRGSNNVRY